jgi:hypothetical protein
LSAYHPVRRHRRRWRLWLWVVGTAGVTTWWVWRHPQAQWWDAPITAVAFGVLLLAALAGRPATQ